MMLFLSACTKNKLGGDSEVKGFVMHHSKFIGEARIFIKFNSSEFPGSDTSLYDVRIISDPKGYYSFKCYKGNYFLFGKGYDILSKEKVSGGIPVKVRSKENLEMTIAVTE
jgi:hypothetical protein